MPNRRAIVFGGTSGIGAATACKLAKLDWKVVVVGRRPETQLDDSVAKSAVAVQADLSVEQDALNAVDKSVRILGGIDGVVHCVGDIFEPKSLDQMDQKRWLRMFNLCVGSAITTIAATLPFIRQSKGAYVFVSSVASTKPYAGISDYCAAKAALDSLMRSVAQEEAQHGVRANAICPAVVDTPLFARSGFTREQAGAWHALRRIGNPGEVAAMVAHLLSPESSWITAQAIAMDGGMSVVR